MKKPVKPVIDQKILLLLFRIRSSYVFKCTTHRDVARSVDNYEHSTRRLIQIVRPGGTFIRSSLVPPSPSLSQRKLLHHCSTAFRFYFIRGNINRPVTTIGHKFVSVPATRVSIHCPLNCFYKGNIFCNIFFLFISAALRVAQCSINVLLDQHLHFF